MKRRLSIVLLALSFAASSECLLRTNIAFAPSSRSLRSKYITALPSLPPSKSNQNQPSASDYYLTPGKPSSYFIVEKYNVPSDGFPSSLIARLFGRADTQRLNMTTVNVTLPSALAMLDSNRYPDVKSSLKAARDGSILIQRQCRDEKQRGGSGDRIYPNDTLYRQEQLDIGASDYWRRSYNENASFRSKKSSPFGGENNVNSTTMLSDVVYEDDHIAIVNKPGGMNIFEHDHHNSHAITRGDIEGSIKRHGAKDLLPFVLKPPANGTRNVLPVPEPAHRLDKPTSGLLLVAKTRPALASLSAQFRDRTVEKTYTAVCYNAPAIIIPAHADSDAITDNDIDGRKTWQCIEEPLDGKSAITFWRVLKQLKHEGVQLSLLELKPKTGRYRQLRRHMAKTKDCPLVGDTVFAKGIENKDGLGGGLGLFLCASSVRFHHPHYKEASDLKMKMGDGAFQNVTEIGHEVTVVNEADAVVMNACIELPQKFASLVG